MPLMFAFKIEERCTEDTTVAALGSFDLPDSAIICRRVDDGEWEPLYASMGTKGRRQLPSCFSLNEESIEALNNLLEVE